MSHRPAVQEPKWQIMTPWCWALSKNILASPEESSFNPLNFGELICLRFSLFRKVALLACISGNSMGDADIWKLIKKREGQWGRYSKKLTFNQPEKLWDTQCVLEMQICSHTRATAPEEPVHALLLLPWEEPFPIRMAHFSMILPAPLLPFLSQALQQWLMSP